MQESGLIVGFRAIVDPAKVGLDHVAFTEVKLSDTREEALREFNAAVRRLPEVEECHMLASSFAYPSKARTADHPRFRLVLGVHDRKRPLWGKSGSVGLILGGPGL